MDVRTRYTRIGPDSFTICTLDADNREKALATLDIRNVRHVALYNDSDVIALVIDHDVVIMSVSTGLEYRRETFPNSQVFALIMDEASPVDDEADTPRFAALLPGTIAVFSLVRPRMVAVVPDAPISATSMACMAGPGTLLFSRADVPAAEASRGFLSTFNLATGEVVPERFRVCDGNVRLLGARRGGDKIFVSSDKSSVVRVYRADSFHPVAAKPAAKPFEGRAESVYALAAFSPDGRAVAMVGPTAVEFFQESTADGQVPVTSSWLLTGVPPTRSVAVACAPIFASYTPDGAWVVIVNVDGTTATVSNPLAVGPAAGGPAQ